MEEMVQGYGEYNISLQGGAKYEHSRKTSSKHGGLLEIYYENNFSGN